MALDFTFDRRRLLKLAGATVGAGLASSVARVQAAAQPTQQAPAAQSPTVHPPVFQIPQGPFIAADTPLNAKQSAALKAFRDAMSTAVNKQYASDSDTGLKALLEKRRSQN